MEIGVEYSTEEIFTTVWRGEMRDELFCVCILLDNLLCEKTTQNERINMKYKKRPKRKYATYWKETAGFDCQKELHIYKFLCGRRMRHKPEVKYCFTRKEDWKKYVYSQYADRSVEQLQNFLFYLEQAKRDVKDEQIINLNYMLPIFAALITGSYISCVIEQAIRMKDIEIIVNPNVLMTGSILFIFVVFPTVFNGIKSVWDSSNKQYFYEDYMEIIVEIIQKKTDVK